MFPVPNPGTLFTKALNVLHAEYLTTLYSLLASLLVELDEYIL
jgi:hypothetical protein